MLGVPYYRIVLTLYVDWCFSASTLASNLPITALAIPVRFEISWIQHHLLSMSEPGCANRDKAFSG